MDYPFWQAPMFSGGLLIAVIAVVHVFIAHIAVGGGLFLILLEWLGERRCSSRIISYVKTHARFFVLLTMVMGGITGVGIWFTISVISPAGTNVLIQNFALGWATEWVFFLGEIVAALTYYYTFERMDRRTHLFVGFCYFLFAWLSLFMINGIIGFMLTPGDWMASRDFFDGIFNPSFWPSLAFRTFLSLMLAGCIGFITAQREKDEETRTYLMRYTALFTALPFVLLVASGYWYVFTLPAEQLEMVLYRSQEIPGYLRIFWYSAPAAFLLAMLAFFRLPRAFAPLLTVLILVAGFAEIGAFEFIREAARRPYLVHGYMYSSGIKVEDVAMLNEEGVLPHTPWLPFTEVTEENAFEAGRELTILQCMPCHGLNGPKNDLLERAAPLAKAASPRLALTAQLTGQGKVLPYMPPFVGTAAEKAATAEFILKRLEQKGLAPAETALPEQGEMAPLEIPPFDPDAATHALLAYADRPSGCLGGMHAIGIIPPPVTLRAQLIYRDGYPMLETPEQAVVSFAPLDAKALQEADSPALSGEMAFDEATGSYTAALPALSGEIAQPMFTLTAKAADSGEVMAETLVSVATPPAMKCGNCHEGPNGGAAHIRKVHDRINRETISDTNAPCQTCHADPATDAPGDPALPSLSAAVHGFHANYLTAEDETACHTCHPAENSQGGSLCLRGLHADRGLTCVSCHGTLADHALALLKTDLDSGNPSRKARAEKLARHLTPVSVAGLAEVPAREPFLQVPDCMSCHDHTELPDPFSASAYGSWAEGEYRYHQALDDTGRLACASCHGAPHALYPAYMGQNPNRDNVQMLQYTEAEDTLGKGGTCAVCHLSEMDFMVHHPVPE